MNCTLCEALKPQVHFSLSWPSLNQSFCTMEQKQKNPLNYQHNVFAPHHFLSLSWWVWGRRKGQIWEQSAGTAITFMLWAADALTMYYKWQVPGIHAVEMVLICHNKTDHESACHDAIDWLLSPVVHPVTWLLCISLQREALHSLDAHITNQQVQGAQSHVSEWSKGNNFLYFPSLPLMI